MQWNRVDVANGFLAYGGDRRHVVIVILCHRSITTLIVIEPHGGCALQ